LMMSLWDALRMNMMISYQELVRTFPWGEAMRQIGNAVPVLLAQKIGQQLYNLLNEEVEPLLCSNFN
ncbi:hypothetical protein ACNIWB_27575, partial [Escherichia coli]